MLLHGGACTSAFASCSFTSKCASGNSKGYYSIVSAGTLLVAVYENRYSENRHLLSIITFKKLEVPSAVPKITNGENLFLDRRTGMSFCPACCVEKDSGTHDLDCSESHPIHSNAFLFIL